MSSTETPGDSVAAIPSATPTEAPSTLGLKAAARLAGVAVSTLQRRRDELEIYGATKDDAGWRIPVAALFSMGLLEENALGVSSTETPGDSVAATPSATPTETPSATPEKTLEAEQLEELRDELSKARKDAAVALAERDAERRRADEHLERAKDAERRLDAMITNQTALSLTVSEQHKALVSTQAPISTTPDEPGREEATPESESDAQEEQAPTQHSTTRQSTESGSESFGYRMRRWFKG